MKKLAILFLSVLLFACSSQRDQDAVYIKKDVANDNIAIDLTTRLKGKAGLRVLGSGSSASFFVRGINSISTNNEPLFVLDNMQIASYPDLYSMVTSADIKRVEVLKSPDELGIYGVRGANGVIKITTHSK